MQAAYLLKSEFKTNITKPWNCYNGKYILVILKLLSPLRGNAMQGVFCEGSKQFSSDCRFCSS